MSQNTFEPNYQFDTQRYRCVVNGVDSVRHCYPTMNSLTQLVIAIEGQKTLQDVAESTFYKILYTNFTQQQITTLPDKITTAQQYWQTMGMGKLELMQTNSTLTSAEMTHSHIDESWRKAQANYHQPINFITAGFIAACAALLTDKPTGSYTVNEIDSLAMGKEKSIFAVNMKENTHGN